jgi:hypothetical protein
MLVPEGDLEVQDRLALALEPEVAGFDDARVHGTDRDLVDRVASTRYRMPLPGSAAAAAAVPGAVRNGRWG